MRLSELLGSRFGDILSNRRARERGLKFLHWSEIHTMAFKSVVVSWREYINWLDGDVSQLVSSSIFAYLEMMLRQRSLTISFLPPSSQPGLSPNRRWRRLLRLRHQWTTVICYPRAASGIVHLRGNVHPAVQKKPVCRKK
jgi:hypothetical protein